MEQVLNLFCLDSCPVSCERYGEGHINLTFLVVTETGKRYILQRLSRAAFSDIPGLMRNVTAVTEFLSARNTDPRSSLHLVPTKAGATWCRDDAGEYWRVYDFVEDSLCLQTPESPLDFYQSAVAFGRFQNQLRDFPAETLCETIRTQPDVWLKWSPKSAFFSPVRRKQGPCSACAIVDSSLSVSLTTTPSSTTSCSMPLPAFRCVSSIWTP